MRKMLLLLLLFVTLFIISACNGEEENNSMKENAITSVEIDSVETGNFTVEKSIHGHVSPIRQMPVMVQQPGEVTTLKVKNGDKVNKNDHLATIKTQMGNQTINAPTDGEIAHLNVQENAFQSNEDPLAMIIDTDQLQATFAVTPTTKELFEADQEINVFIEEKKYDAKVLPIDTLPNETGQYQIDLEIENEDRNILPGMTAKINVEDKRINDTVIIPTEAVLTENDETYVFIVTEEDTAKKVAVDIEETLSEQTAVEGELEKGAQVIVNGHFTLSDGAKVEIVKEGN